MKRLPDIGANLIHIVANPTIKLGRKRLFFVRTSPGVRSLPLVQCGSESFFHLLKTERIRRKTYKAREDARQDIFDYIELFYYPKRKHGNNLMLSPVAFERQHKVKLQVV